MKVRHLLLLFSSFVIFSCNKGHCEDGKLNKDETDIDCGGECGLCPIEYPETSPNGPNLLDTITTNFITTTNWSEPNYYSLRAYLPTSTSLTVHLTKNQGEAGIWWFTSSSVTGWSPGDYTGGQWFHTTTEGFVDLKLYFEGTFEGKVDYFENGASTSATPTFSKSINVTE